MFPYSFASYLQWLVWYERYNFMQEGGWYADLLGWKYAEDDVLL